MAEIVNLRQFRKQKACEESGKTAQENRAVHGRTRAEKQRAAAEKAAAKAHLDGHRLDPGPGKR